MLGTPRAQEDEVVLLMESMSAAAKVGQLFLVAFPGVETSEDAAIAELIRDYHIGGVVLLPENGNIVNEGDTPAQVATLVGQLQQVAWDATRPVTETTTGEEVSPGPFIPLFVAVNHEGNGVPHTGIVNGTTPLPSAMALGATWNPSHAENVGQVVGQELRAVGVNLLLGPSLDVLETPRPKSAGDLGVRSFGGEPFWVGQMGQAYVRGVHEGASGRVAVVAKHFPGLGSSDRSLDEEAPTVQRTLEKLRQVDLAPFFSVAQAEDLLARPDGLLVSHIRFQGLEGDRFVKTRPISVDSQVLPRLLGLPELAGWRETGGVTVSDGLGLRALRRFYAPNEESFNSRRIAQEAFLAGNDILILSQFALTDNWGDRIANVKSTITFFRQKYESEPSFQVSVDQAVARILRLKLALYDDTFWLGATKPSVERVSGQVGLHQEVLSAIGQDAVTLLSPPSPDLVPSPPTTEDNIVIFSDGRSGQPCATCAPVSYIEPLALQNTMTRLYGPGGTGQISPWRITSFTFVQLNEYLNVPASLPTPTPASGEVVTLTLPYAVESALQNAAWIIFAMLDPRGDPPQSEVVQRFFAERADALRGPHLIVLAYGAPYYLDATEISKLSAYYVTYGRIEPFIEASVRALFGEFGTRGTPPVSVPGTNYDLPTQTSPDPRQEIALSIGEPLEEGEPTPGPPQLKVGDELELRTGVIVDRNGHPVPDGTPVQIIFTYPQEGLEQSLTVTTRGGIAKKTVTLDRMGQLDIYIQADPVPRAVRLQLTVQQGEQVAEGTQTPTSTSPAPTVLAPTLTSGPTPGVEETPQPTPATDGEGTTSMEWVGMLDLVLALLGVLVVGGIGYYAMRSRNEPISHAVRVTLWCVVGGLALYLAYALHLPGATWLRERTGIWAAAWVALLGSMMPLIIARIVGQRKPAE
jgi:beta-N-acetylhexosaminidase